MPVDTENEKLSFPQHYWLLLCIVVAIFSPLAVNWLDAAAHHMAYKQATESTSANSSSGSASPSGGTVDSAGK